MDRLSLLRKRSLLKQAYRSFDPVWDLIMSRRTNGPPFRAARTLVVAVASSLPSLPADAGFTRYLVRNFTPALINIPKLILK